MRSCIILVNKREAGILVETASGGFIFSYSPSYLADPKAEPVSLTLPLRSEPYRSPYLFATFANMLSEGANREVQSQLLHIDKDDDFGIMLETCQYDTIGAVTVQPL